MDAVMKNWMLILSILFTASAYSAEYRIETVDKKPVPIREYIRLWEDKAVQLCRLNAKDYNIVENTCSGYISAKFSGCRHLLKKQVNKYINNSDQGREMVSEYFQCINAWPHCNGFEIKNNDDLIKHCS